MATNKEIFIEKYATLIQKYAIQYGFFPSVLMAQAAEESGWGSSNIAKNANNIFGIKKGSWTGATLNGYRKYATVEECIINYCSVVMAQSRYANVKNATDYKQALVYIQAGGYTPDTSYPARVISLLEYNNFQRFDTPPPPPLIPNPVPPSSEDDPQTPTTLPPIKAPDEGHWAEFHFKNLNNKGITIHERRFSAFLLRGEGFVMVDRAKGKLAQFPKRN